MGECKIGFTAKDNGLAFELYKGLSRTGVACATMDTGYSVINHAGIHCSNKGDRSCVKGAGDGIVSPEEVFEYALKDYEKYRKLLEGVLGRPLPWVLDDMDPTTTFDADIRKKVQGVIDLLKGILAKNGVEEGTEAYKEKLAVGLFWFVTVPDKKNWSQTSDRNKEKEEEKLSREAIRLHVKTDLENNGLGDFWKYLVQNGGLGVKGDNSSELTAIEALEKNQGACTEYSKILFAVLKLAGLNPMFVYESPHEIKTDIRRFNPLAKYFMDQLNNYSIGAAHIYIAHVFNGRPRLLDPSLFDSHAAYELYHLFSLRQYLSIDVVNYGGVWADKKEFGKAIADDSMAIEIDPRNDLAYVNRGNAWSGKNELMKALADYSKAIEINSDSSGAFYNRAGLWADKKEWDKAIADYSRAIAIGPEFYEAHEGRGKAWVAKQEWDKALADFSRAIEIKPDYHEAYYDRGIVWSEKKEWDKAMADYSVVIRNATGHYGARNNRGILWAGREEWDKAIADYSKAIEINPKTVDAYNNRGKAWIEKRQYDKAFADFSEGVKIDPKFTWGHRRLGQLSAIAGRYRDAVSNFAESFRLTEGNVDGFIEWLARELTPHWARDGKKAALMTAFAKEGDIDVTLATATFIFHYAFWSAGYKDQAVEKFRELAGAIDFKERPSPAVRKFIKELLVAMPEDMKKNVEVREMVKTMSGKL